MKLVYKPFGIIVGLAAGYLGRFLFSKVWEAVADEEPPEPTTRETSWGKVIAVGAVQGLIVRATAVAVNRAGAIAWEHLTGTWPGEEEPDPS
ncbi:MAG TPA: DUF4235 domain-containing protein [Solirubrobacteraceae bacterium]|nr:DUF4235 domain-containing protein [Solirubrobacteraceae bacterium]